MTETIHFVQNFKSDLEQIRFKGEPYAFVRFGDGERALSTNRPVRAAARWRYDGSDTPLSRRVKKLVTSNIPGLYMGISCPCCDNNAHKWYLETVATPLDRITYANLFVNGNYKRFLEKFNALKREDFFLVSHAHGDIDVPLNAVCPAWDYTQALEKLLTVKKTILVAAGPVKCGLIHDYWTQVAEENRQIIIDVGSALDVIVIHGKATRGYHHPEKVTATRICHWS